MQVGATQVGVTQVGGTQVGGTQVGATQVGVMQVGATQVGVTQVGVTQVGGTQVGGTQVGPLASRFIIQPLLMLLQDDFQFFGSWFCIHLRDFLAALFRACRLATRLGDRFFFPRLTGIAVPFPAGRAR